MRWLRRSVLLSLIIMVVTPAQAQAWFEWLDRLSGPGRWYGFKVDLRALCFGKPMPFEQIEKRIVAASNSMRQLNVSNRSAVQANEDEWMAIVKQLEGMDEGLNALSDLTLEPMVRKSFDFLTNNRVGVLSEADVGSVEDHVIDGFNRLRRVSIAIASPGILISLCPSGTLRSFAIELGFTGLGTPGNVDYADNRTIWLTTYTGGVSYRVPLPVGRDIVDLGTNVGLYRFHSKGFENFSGWTIEPFVDFHLPTRMQLDGSKWERFFGRFTVRGGLQFFPGGFKAEQFAAQPGIPDISGREASASVTVFFRVKG